jgi:hypothetical protein
VLPGTRLGLTTRLGGDGRSARGREEGAQEGTRGGDGRGKKEEACVFPTNKHRVIKKTIPAITTMVTATHTVIPNLTSEELVKFMDVAVASKYGSDLMNFTRTITEEVHSTLDTFKTDLQNMLPRQIRSVVQQVHGESRGKQSDLEPSTPYSGSTSAPGNTGTLYSGNTTASGNMGNIGGTSTSHSGNTSGNVIWKICLQDTPHLWFGLENIVRLVFVYETL